VRGETLTVRCMARLVTLVVLLVLPASAAGFVRMGPDVTQPLPSGGFHFAAIGCQGGQYSPCSFLNLRSTNPEVIVAAPFDGVITSWSVRAGCCTEPQTVAHSLTIETYKQGTQDGLFNYGYAIPELLGSSFEIPPGNQLLGSTVLELPSRVPIKAGERVGISADNPIQLDVYDTIEGVTMTDIAKGVEYKGEPYGTVYQAALAISARLEPDADHDGYGDETQDCQPADPALHGTECIKPVPTPIPTPVIGGIPCASNCSTGGGAGGVVYIPPPPGGGIVSSDGIHFYIPLSCPAGATRPCGGYLVIVPEGARKAAAPARVPFSVAPGRKARIKVSLNRKLRARLHRAGRLKVSIEIVPTGGTAKSFKATIKLRASAKR
jgi:hypothetical protein